MKGKIIIEEAFQLPELAHQARNYSGSKGGDLLEKQLVELDNRISQMDEAGVELQVLSLTSPGAQGLADKAAAEDLAKRANDYVADFVKKNPKRFAAFGAVSMHDANQAAQEATRCVKELGLCGIMLNDFQSSGPDGDEMLMFDDLEKYAPFWKTMEELDTPVYFHPRMPSPTVYKHLYAKRPWLSASAWGFANQLSIHVLGVICAGTFDRWPRLQMMVGHMGEHIVGDLWRLDHKLDRNRWPNLPMNPHKLVRDYLMTNVFLTTSGHFSTRTLQNAITEIGADRLIFSVDYPYEDTLLEGSNWMDTTDISDLDRVKIGRTTALKVLKLDRGLHKLDLNLSLSDLEVGGLKGECYPDSNSKFRAHALGYRPA